MEIEKVANFDPIIQEEEESKPSLLQIFNLMKNSIRCLQYDLNHTPESSSPKRPNSYPCATADDAQVSDPSKSTTVWKVMQWIRSIPPPKPLVPHHHAISMMWALLLPPPPKFPNPVKIQGSWWTILVIVQPLEPPDHLVLSRRLSVMSTYWLSHMSHKQLPIELSNPYLQTTMVGALGG